MKVHIHRDKAGEIHLGVSSGPYAAHVDVRVVTATEREWYLPDFSVTIASGHRSCLRRLEGWKNPSLWEDHLPSSLIGPPALLRVVITKLLSLARALGPGYIWSCDPTDKRRCRIYEKFLLRAGFEVRTNADRDTLYFRVPGSPSNNHLAGLPGWRKPKRASK